MKYTFCKAAAAAYIVIVCTYKAVCGISVRSWSVRHPTSVQCRSHPPPRSRREPP
ncbi:hypothetical protein FOMPIDRAFT_1024178, partial [Fomitopsis schrenkii]